jgi:hypothetical protein
MKGLKTILKRDKFDTVISDLCRIRADFTCQKCHYVSSEGQATYKDRFMTASHFNGRGNGNVARYDTDLITCLCAKCHNFVETRPKDHTNFIISIVGEPFLDRKCEAHHKPRKMTKAEKQEMYEHYKSELKRVKEMRKIGTKGYIETVSYF